MRQVRPSSPPRPPSASRLSRIEHGSERERVVHPGPVRPARSHQPPNASLGGLARIFLARELEGSFHYAL